MKKQALSSTEKGVLLYLVACDFNEEDYRSGKLIGRGANYSQTVIELSQKKIYKHHICPGEKIRSGFGENISNPYQSSKEEVDAAVRSLAKKGYVSVYRNNRGSRIIPNASAIDLLRSENLLDGAPSMTAYRDFLSRESRLFEPVPLTKMGHYNDELTVSYVSFKKVRDVLYQELGDSAQTRRIVAALQSPSTGKGRSA